MNKIETVLDRLDPEIIMRVATRRDALGSLGRWGAGAAASSVAVALGTMAKKAFAQGLPQEIIDALNFALTLEYLASDFYNMGLALGIIPAEDQAIFQTISEHENAHVALLETLLGANAVSKPAFDFTAGGMFDPFNMYSQFQALSQVFEDTGVRAYKGQAGALISNDDILLTALRIHSVEARHASEVRRLRDNPGWIENEDFEIPTLAPIYAGEGTNAAFDEPLSREAVLAIVDPFIEDAP